MKSHLISHELRETEKINLTATEALIILREKYNTFETEET